MVCRQPATAGRVRQAESLADQSRIARDETELIVQVEVRRAFADLTQAAELIAAARKSVEQAEEAVRIAQVRYRVGTSTQLELLQAQSALTASRTSRLRAIYAHCVAAAQMRRAMGVAEFDYVDTVAIGQPPESAVVPIDDKEVSPLKASARREPR